MRGARRGHWATCLSDVSVGRGLGHVQTLSHLDLERQEVAGKKTVQASLIEVLPVCTHLAEIVATFSIQAMIWPPKVLTWWFVCGGSTSSTLSTLVCSASTASWYSWHSPGSTETRKSHQSSTSPSATSQSATHAAWYPAEPYCCSVGL